MMALMKILVVALTLALGGCSRLPFNALTPTENERDRIDTAITLIQASSARLPFAPDETLYTWFKEHAPRIEMIDSAKNVDAWRFEGVIYVQRRAAVILSSTDLAGVLLHEARHADMRHTCGDGTMDATLEEWGAWAVNAWWLEKNDDEGSAKDIRNNWICH